MRQLISAVLLLLCTGTYTLSVAQKYTLNIDCERKEDRSVDFSYSKEEYGSFYVNLIFPKLEHAHNTTFSGVLSSMGGRFFTLKPCTEDKYIDFSYHYTFIRGVPNPRIDSSFVYLMPVPLQKQIKVLNHFNIDSRYFGKTEPRGWKSFQFNLNPGDTIFAARKGLVVEVVDGFEPDSNKEVSFSSNNNSILIEHEDGTLARYSVLKKGTMMVKPGDNVIPRAPLALAGTFDTQENTQVRFFVYYLSEDKIVPDEKKTVSNRKNYYAFIDPVFCTTEGNTRLQKGHDYRADFKTEYIARELSKREKKKLGL